MMLLFVQRTPLLHSLSARLCMLSSVKCGHHLELMCVYPCCLVLVLGAAKKDKSYISAIIFHHFIKQIKTAL